MKIHAIDALVPFYGENGSNCTWAITEDGEKAEQKFNIRTAMKKVYEYYQVDIGAYRKQLTGSLGNVAIPFHAREGKTYILLKMRDSIGKDDGAYGWVNIHGINKLTPCGKSTVIKLNSGIEINIIMKASTVQKRINNGLTAATLLGKAHPWKDDSLSRPVVLGDIVELCEKINLLLDKE
ncbi:MAG: hypothetical protein GXZ11_09055 [Tissierellia bacterium]|nr:hypothetical protein [Tissierellia bacterium]